jgi:hypothetical protein
MAVGLGLGVIVLFSDLLGIIMGGIAWKTSGSPRWFVASVILPIIQLLAFVVLRATL